MLCLTHRTRVIRVIYSNHCVRAMWLITNVYIYFTSQRRSSLGCNNWRCCRVCTSTSRVWSGAILALINDCFLYICVHFDYPQYPALSFPPLGQDFGIQHLDLWISPKWDLDESKKRCFKASNGILKLFSASGLAKNAIWWRQKSDDSICQMSLWRHFLLLAQTKLRFFSSR